MLILRNGRKWLRNLYRENAFSLYILTALKKKYKEYYILNFYTLNT